MKFKLSAYVETTVEVRDENMLIEAIENFQDSCIGQHLASDPSRMLDNQVHIQCLEYKSSQLTRY